MLDKMFPLLTDEQCMDIVRKCALTPGLGYSSRVFHQICDAQRRLTLNWELDRLEELYDGLAPKEDDPGGYYGDGYRVGLMKAFTPLFNMLNEEEEAHERDN